MVPVVGALMSFRRVALCSLFAALAAWTAAPSPAQAVDAAQASAYQPPAPFPAGWSLDASADGVFARRSQSSAVIAQDTGTGAPVVTASDLPFDTETGLDARARIGYGAWSLEGRYFGGFKWKSASSTTSPAVWNFPTVPALFGLGVAALDSTYDGKLRSWEANLRWRANSNIVLFVGGRWISQPENLLVTADFGANTANVSWDSALTARGPQIGIDARLFGPRTPFNPMQRVFLDVDARFAYLKSSGTQAFLVTQSVGPSFGANGSFSRNTFAYELGAMLGVEVTPNIELRAGYRYFVLQDAVMAPDLIAATNVVTATVGPASSRLAVSAVTLGLRALIP